MESRTKLFGHPVHPMRVVFPISLLGQPWSSTSSVSRPATIPSGTRASRIGLLHGSGNVIVLGLFALSWWMRREAPGLPDMLALTASLLGFVLALVTGWLGGELVDRLSLTHRRVIRG